MLNPLQTQLVTYLKSTQPAPKGLLKKHLIAQPQMILIQPVAPVLALTQVILLQPLVPVLALTQVILLQPVAPVLAQTQVILLQPVAPVLALHQMILLQLVELTKLQCHQIQLARQTHQAQVQQRQQQLKLPDQDVCDENGKALDASFYIINLNIQT